VDTERTDDSWSAPVRDESEDESLVVDLEGYEGPLDVLLALARVQKVDITRISILQLAEQYLAFISSARRLRLEVAADYLVMAAWLAYLKSRLLLPEDETEDEPSGPEMAARLAFQLQRLDAMREAAARLMARDRLGRDVFFRGMPEGIRIVRKSEWEVSLFELLRAYAEHRTRETSASYNIRRREWYSVEQAHDRLRRMLGAVPGWERLEAFLPAELAGTPLYRSAVTSTLSASLELAKNGSLELRQTHAFGPIFMRRRDPAPETAAVDADTLPQSQDTEQE
jgi:segregation and condensation protein A